MDSFILFGDIITCNKEGKTLTYPNSYIICTNGLCQGIFKEIPNEFKDLQVKDYKNHLILPGFFDLHVHASQYNYRGTGMDLKLLDWLDTYAFPEETKFKDLSYAKKAYSYFVEALQNTFTTRACIFATRHKAATISLMKMLEQTGLITYVGLVQMDQNAPDTLRQENAECALQETKEYLDESKEFINTHPILTPRFAPSCSDALLKGLGDLNQKVLLPVQSHLNENPSEVAFVKELFPWSKNYSDVYDQYHLFGQTKTIMAHCIYNQADEINLMKNDNLYIAHCPESNMNISSGIAPIKKLLENQIQVGLGSDIAGGSSISILKAMEQAIQVSKLSYACLDKTSLPLSITDVFNMATRIGGSFFGNVGIFDKGYEFDCLVINDSQIKSTRDFSLIERLERLVYCGDERLLVDKYCKGIEIKLNK